MPQATADRTPAPDVVFLYPGDLNTPTGGYVYDRNLITALGEIGLRVRTQTLGTGYPTPSRDTRAAAEAHLADLADGQTVVIDGLAYGVLADAAARHAERLRLIALVHHPLAEETGLTPARARHLRDAERLALAQARAIVTTSQATADLVMRDYGVDRLKLRVIEPGIDRSGSTSYPGRSAAKHINDPVRLLAVGSLIPRKDYPTLLNALARLGGRPVHLDIAGSAAFDPDNASLIRAQVDRLDLARDVTFHGALTRRDLNHLYANGDIFVLTTRYEGYGMAFTEAMAHGLPVVATGSGAVADTVPQAAGFVLPVGDASMVADALCRLVDDPAMRKRMGSAARAHVDTLANWHDQARRFAALFRDLAAEAHR